MPLLPALLYAALLFAALLFDAIPAAPAAAQETPPVNFEDDVEPILRGSCMSCHRGSRARNGLELKSVATILEGGSSGPAIVPGDASSSLMYLAAAHEREPFMPPDGDRLGEEELAVLQAWIDGGAPATADGAPAGGAADTGALALVPPPVPGGAAVMPEGLATQPVWSTERGAAVRAVAASPFAPLAAVAGHQQVALYRVPDGELLGTLPFPEGEVHALRFSPTGALLLAGGGRGAASGRAVAWDVRTGERVFALGDEPDVVLAADVSVDHWMAVLGGPDRVVRAYEVRTGEILYELDAHTDWVTAVALSPDGVLLATGDRSGGLFVWEALSGREFHALPASKGAVTALGWRADSSVLAVGDEEGVVRLFDMENGRQLRRWKGSTSEGVLDLHYLRDGRILTGGRDRRARLWDAAGKELAQLAPEGGLVTAVAADHAGEHLLVGDFKGRVSVFPAAGGEALASLRPNPATDEERELAAARAELPRHEAELARLEEAERAAREALGPAEERATAASAAAVAAAERAAAAEVAAAGVRRSAEEAAFRRKAYESPLASRRRAMEEALARAEELAAVEDEAAQALRAAVEHAVGAEEALGLAAEGPEREAAAGEHRLAERLLEGATAAAQLAASRAAEARVALERREAEVELWSERAAPRIQAAEALFQRLGATDQEAAAARSAADAAAAEEASRAAELEAARAAARSAAEELERARAALAAGRGRLAAAEEAWERLRPALEAAGGRVLPLP